MLTSYLGMQNAIIASNMATAGMMQASDNMLASTASFGNSQPIRPSFSSLSSDELQIKSNETKVTALNSLMDAYEEALGNDIKRATPKFGGLDYKA